MESHNLHEFLPSRTTESDGQLSGTVTRQRDFDVNIGQCVVSDSKLACAVLIRHKTQSDSEVKTCLLPKQLYILSQDSVWYRIRVLSKRRELHSVRITSAFLSPSAGTRSVETATGNKRRGNQGCENYRQRQVV